MNEAFYKLEQAVHGEVLVPTHATASGWGAGQLRGMAVSGALARATEREMAGLDAAAGMRPARFTLDLFRAARAVPSRTRTEVVRQGRRLILIDAFFEQEGKTVARSATLFLNPTCSPPGNVWNQAPTPGLPPAGMVPEADDERIYFEEGRGWVPSSQARHAVLRRQSWHFPMQIVEGETQTPFQMAASICDVSNVISNWGDRGLEFINGDVTLTLARLPKEQNMGLSATGRVEEDGVSTGSAVLYDCDGVFGMSLVTGLANPEFRTNPKTRRAMETERV